VRTTAFPLLLLSALALGACAGQTDPVEQEPEVASMVLDIAGSSEYTATLNGFTPQSLTLDEESFTVTSVEFRRVGGGIEEIDPNDFRLSAYADVNGTALPGDLSFIRSGPFGGTLTGLDPGQTIDIFFALQHVTESHLDFGPIPLTVSRTGGGGGL
jgi:hypothetical protein